MDLTSDDLNLDDLLVPEQLTLDEERNSSLAVSEFLIHNSDSVDLSSYRDTYEVNTKELIKEASYNFSKTNEDKLFELLKTKNDLVNPQLFFPKIKHINDLFWFLHNLNKAKPYKSKIIFNTNNEMSDLSNKIIDAAVFFNFITLADNGSDVYMITTSDFNNFKNKSIEEQYLLFLQNIGSDKTVRDCIVIQLNDPIYDRLSKKMVLNKLKDNYNIKEEKLSDKEISVIVNNVRYWYLDIKKYLL